METIGSKRSYALIWCMPNNDDDDGFCSVEYLFSVGHCSSCPKVVSDLHS